jgi:lysophospholipase L1-like esterase
MKRKFVYIILLFLANQFACRISDNGPVATDDSVYPPLPAITIQWTDDNSIVCFGTSLTYGYCGGSPPVVGPIFPRNIFDRKKESLILGLDEIKNEYKQCEGDSTYPSFLQDSLRIKVYNQGYVGARTSYALSLLQDSVLSKKPALVLLEFTANEFLMGTPVHTADSLLSLLVQRIIDDSIKVILLSFINPAMVYSANRPYWTEDDIARAMEYWNMLNGVAARYSLPFINYPFRGIFGHADLMSDMFHPNGKGYKKWADNIYYALIETFKMNGMMK